MNSLLEDQVAPIDTADMSDSIDGVPTVLRVTLFFSISHIEYANGRFVGFFSLAREASPFP